MLARVVALGGPPDAPALVALAPSTLVLGVVSEEVITAIAANDREALVVGLHVCDFLWSGVGQICTVTMTMFATSSKPPSTMMPGRGSVVLKRSTSASALSHSRARTVLSSKM